MKIVSLKAIPITQVVERSVYKCLSDPYHAARVEIEEGVTGYGEVCDSYACTYPLSVQTLIANAQTNLLLGEDPAGTLGR